MTKLKVGDIIVKNCAILCVYVVGMPCYRVVGSPAIPVAAGYPTVHREALGVAYD